MGQQMTRQGNAQQLRQKLTELSQQSLQAHLVGGSKIDLGIHQGELHIFKFYKKHCC